MKSITLISACLVLGAVLAAAAGEDLTHDEAYEAFPPVEEEQFVQETAEAVTPHDGAYRRLPEMKADLKKAIKDEKRREARRRRLAKISLSKPEKFKFKKLGANPKPGKNGYSWQDAYRTGKQYFLGPSRRRIGAGFGRRRRTLPGPRPGVPRGRKHRILDNGMEPKLRKRLPGLKEKGPKKKSKLGKWKFSKKRRGIRVPKKRHCGACIATFVKSGGCSAIVFSKKRAAKFLAPGCKHCRKAAAVKCLVMKGLAPKRRAAARRKKRAAIARRVKIANERRGKARAARLKKKAAAAKKRRWSERRDKAKKKARAAENRIKKKKHAEKTAKKVAAEKKKAAELKKKYRAAQKREKANKKKAAERSGKKRRESAAKAKARAIKREKQAKEKKKKERAVKAKIAAERKRKATEKKKKVARREKRAKYVKRERAGKEKSAKARKAEKAKKAKARELSAKESKYKRRERADKAAKKRAKAEKDGKRARERRGKEQSAKRAAAARQRRINNERRSKATCTVTAYEHNHFRGRVLSRRSTCSSLQHYHMPRSGRRRGYMASSFRLSSGCRQVQLWDEDRCRFNYGDNVNIRSSVRWVKWDLNDDICAISVWGNRNGWCRYRL